MVNSLIGIHAILGELGIVAFLWVFVEILNSTPSCLRRAKLVACLGVIFFFASWIVGGYYYATDYGSIVKPVIKEGPQPWAHLVFTEAKEHVFLFLPFLSVLAYALIRKYQSSLSGDKNPSIKKAILILCIAILVIGAMMAVMGYLISSGYRIALEAKI